MCLTDKGVLMELNGIASSYSVLIVHWQLETLARSMTM